MEIVFLHFSCRSFKRVKWKATIINIILTNNQTLNVACRYEAEQAITISCFFWERSHVCLFLGATITLDLWEIVRVFDSG